MRLYGERVTAQRMLLLNQVELDPGCGVFELESPLFLMEGDQLWVEGHAVVVARSSGAVERPAGGYAYWNRRWRLI